MFRAFYKRDAPAVAYKIVPGTRLRISGVDFGDSERTILLAVSKNCRYCTESAPFYKRLDAAIKDRSIRTIALFPENDTEPESYVAELGITAKAHNVSLTTLGITKIPALVITDNTGSVLEMWNGKLPPRVQSVVFERLNLPDTRPKSEWLVEEKDLAELLSKNQGAILLDVRNRESFSRQHLPKAINIPVDELTIRAGNELSVDNLIVISGGESEADLAYILLDTQGFSHLLTLLRSASQ